MTNSARIVPNNQPNQLLNNPNKVRSEIYEKEESKPSQPIKL